MNAMYRFIVLFILFFHSQNKSVYSQNTIHYHSLSNQACKALEDGFTDQAYIFLTEAFSLSKHPIAADLFNMAKCYSQMNEPDSTEKYIDLALHRNPKIGRAIRIHNLWFEPVLGTEKWKTIVQKTYNTPLVPIEVEEQILQLQKIHLLNIAPLSQLKELPDSERYSDSIIKLYWDTVKYTTLLNAHLLDSVLLAVSDICLVHPAFEEAFLTMMFYYKTDYWKSGQEMYLRLIEKGFLTPDILSPAFIEEYFGENNDFNYLSYSPRHIDYYVKYGVSFDHYMCAFRTFNNWKYDEKELTE